jgi:hypothetical protein
MGAPGLEPPAEVIESVLYSIQVGVAAGVGPVGFVLVYGFSFVPDFYSMHMVLLNAIDQNLQCH